jgi:hypothetical protein
LYMDRDEISTLYRGPSIDASYQFAVCLTKRFQRRWFFRNLPIRNKNCLWWPCLLMDRDEMCNLYREPSNPIINMATTGNSCFWLVEF